MSKFIFIIIFFPILQILLGSIKRKAYGEEFEGVLFLPKSCKKILNVCSVITVIIAIALATIYEISDSYAVCVFFLILCMLYLILGEIVQRYNIVVNNTYMIITPPIGKKRKIMFNEIEKFQESLEGGIKIFVNGKKIVTVDKISVGFHEFCQLIEQKGYRIESR